jgi:hypothetical protein
MMIPGDPKAPPEPRELSDRRQHSLRRVQTKPEIGIVICRREHVALAFHFLSVLLVSNPYRRISAFCWAGSPSKLTDASLAEHTVCNVTHPWRLSRQGGAL